MAEWLVYLLKYTSQRLKHVADMTVFFISIAPHVVLS